MAGKMSGNMEHKSITHDFILPARYDPRVVVKPCQTARVPYLPVEIIYQIAEALPQPREVLNLTLANKETWEYLHRLFIKPRSRTKQGLSTDMGVSPPPH